MNYNAASAGAEWFNVTSTSPQYPSNGHGGATATASASVIGATERVMIEAVLVEGSTGLDPMVTLVDGAGDDIDDLYLYRDAPAAPASGDFVACYRGVTDYGASADTITPSIGGTVVVANIVPRLSNVRHTGIGRATPATDSLTNDDVGATMQPVNTTTIGIARTTTAENVDHRYIWEVIEHTGSGGGVNEFIVRLSTATTITNTNTTITSSAIAAIVDYTKCVVFMLGTRNQRAAASWDSATAKAVVNSDKTVTFTRGNGTGDLVIRYAVVEFTGTNWRVIPFQYNPETDTPGTRESFALSASVSSWGSAFIMHTFLVPSGKGTNAESGAIVLPSTTSTAALDVVMSAEATDVDTGAYAISGWVVSNPDITVTRINGFDGEGATLGRTDTSQTYTIPAVNTATTFLMAGAISEGDTAELPRPNVGYRLASSTSVELSRGRSGSLIHPHIQVVECRPSRRLEGTSLLWSGRSRGMEVRGRIGAKVNEAGTRVKVIYRRLAP